MQFHSATSTAESTSEAVESAVKQLRARLNNVDLAAVFFTGHHVPESADLVERLWLELDPQAIVGCSAEGVIGGDVEIERSPGIAVLAGAMPDVRIHPIHIATDDWRDLLGSPEDLRERLGVGEETRAIIGLGDPWTTPLQQFMQALDAMAPQAPLIGGMASAARERGQNVLVRNDQTFDEGLVGVSLSGPLEVQTVVSQGARPIGRPLVITKAHDNVIEQLGGKSAMEVLREIILSLSKDEQALLQHGLLIGRAISEYRESFARGDFLVRNITGADQKSGAIALADYVRVGQTVQFHVRDAASADEDLKLMLESAAKSGQPAGGLLFSCNGRGTRMFDSANHDISLARQTMPQAPLAGFFAAGEIGPVGGKNFIHGHTASFALLRNPS
ncbi:MAG TPA: FIST N-terminal domain-containing protein [Tepidisphaeraceae bacterium]|jgi:small ligand-binding sensory domain FIST